MSGHIFLLVSCLSRLCYDVVLLLSHISPIDKVEVLRVDFGGQTPVVTNMRMSDLNTKEDTTSTSTTLILNFDLAISAPDCQLVLRARVGGKR